MGCFVPSGVATNASPRISIAAAKAAAQFMEAPAGLGVWRPGGACIGRGRGTKRNEYHFQGADYEQENLQDAHHEYFEVELDPEALMGLGEAAKELGMTQAGVFRAIERGGLQSGQRNRQGIVGTYYRRRE